MTTDLEAAAKAYRRAQDAVVARRTELRRLIVEARDAEMKQADIVRKTGFTREAVRQILDAHDKAVAAAEAESEHSTAE